MNKSPLHITASLQKEEGDAITAMCSCVKFRQEIYKVNQTIRLQSPKTTDPNSMNPNDNPWITTFTNDVGSKNHIVSRVLLQNCEILKAAWFQKAIDKNPIIILLHSIKERLLECEKIAKKIQSEIDSLILKIETQGVPIQGKFIHSFPFVSDLESNCSAFLINAKKVIQIICKLPAKFIQLDGSDNNFKNLGSKISKFLGEDSTLVKFINDNSSSISHIIDLRNFDEHPKEEKRTIIENFKLMPDKQLCVPQWYITGETPQPIKEEMAEIVNYLLEITEAMLIYLVMISVKKEIPYFIEELEETKVDQNKPIKYRLSIDMSKIKIKNE